MIAGKRLHVHCRSGLRHLSFGQFLCEKYLFWFCLFPHMSADELCCKCNVGNLWDMIIFLLNVKWIENQNATNCSVLALADMNSNSDVHIRYTHVPTLFLDTFAMICSGWQVFFQTYWKKWNPYIKVTYPNLTWCICHSSTIRGVSFTWCTIRLCTSADLRHYTGHPQ